MPKQRIKKEDVLSAAYSIAKSQGAQAATVKGIAEKIGCSVQPIYTYCENMEALRAELAVMAGKELKEYMEVNVDKRDVFRSTGLCYLKFAKEQPNLFALYFGRKRENVNSFNDLYLLEASPDMPKLISQSTNLTEEQAKLLHINMIIYNMGLSFIVTNGGENISTHELENLLCAAHDSFLNQFKGEKI